MAPNTVNDKAAGRQFEVSTEGGVVFINSIIDRAKGRREAYKTLPLFSGLARSYK